MKIYHCGGSEWYPCYTLHLTTTANPDYMDSIDLSEEDIEFCMKAKENFDKAQNLIKEAVYKQKKKLYKE